MADKDWKRWEREVAQDLGGYRGPKAGDHSDVKGLPDVAPECKLQGRLSFKTEDIEQAIRNAAAVGKQWIVAYKVRRQRRKYVLLDYEYYKELRNSALRKRSLARFSLSGRRSP